MEKRVCIITLSFLIIFHLFAINVLADTWRLLIKAMGQGFHPSNVVIGIEDLNSGTWPAAPLMPNYAARIKISDQYGEDTRLPGLVREVWDLDVSVGVPEELTEEPNKKFPVGNAGSVADANQPDFFPNLSWDPNKIGLGKLMELRLRDANGLVIVGNMKKTNTYQTKREDAIVSGYYEDMNSRARMRYTVIFEPFDIQQIPLFQGWNLISFQINHCYYQDTTPTVFIPQGVIMQDVGNLADWLSNDANSPLRDAADPNKAGDWHRVTSFDSAGDHVLDKYLPPQNNTLTYLSVGYGYWIKMNAPGILVLKGTFISTDTPLVLQNGWNLIGYIPHNTCYAGIAPESVCPYTSGVYPPDEGIVYCPVDPLISSVFASIKGQYSRITSFDSCAGAMIFDIQLLPIINTLHYIGPKYGYWIKIEDPAGAELIFPKNCAGI